MGAPSLDPQCRGQSGMLDTFHSRLSNYPKHEGPMPEACRGSLRAPDAPSCDARPPGPRQDGKRERRCPWRVCRPRCKGVVLPCRRFFVAWISSTGLRRCLKSAPGSSRVEASHWLHVEGRATVAMAGGPSGGTVEPLDELSQPELVYTKPPSYRARQRAKSQLAKQEALSAPRPASVPRLLRPARHVGAAWALKSTRPAVVGQSPAPAEGTGWRLSA